MYKYTFFLLCLLTVPSAGACQGINQEPAPIEVTLLFTTDVEGDIQDNALGGAFITEGFESNKTRNGRPVSLMQDCDYA